MQGSSGVARGAAEHGVSRMRSHPGALLTTLAVLAYVTWLIVDDPELPRGVQASTARVGPIVIGPSQLGELAGSGVPAYWSGPIPGSQLELTKTATGRIFVRYLAKDEGIGSRRKRLTIATYPQPEAYERLRSVGARRGSRTAMLGDGGLAVAGRGKTTSAFLAVPGGDYQVEVFHPMPGRAWSLIVARRIRPAP
jgi:hypothetical protein